MSEMTETEKTSNEIMACASGATTGGTMGLTIPGVSPFTGMLGAGAGCAAGLGVAKAAHAVNIRDPYIINCVSGGVTGAGMGVPVPFLSMFAVPAGAVYGCFVGLGIAKANEGIDKANAPYRPQHNLPSKPRSEQQKVR